MSTAGRFPFGAGVADFATKQTGAYLSLASGAVITMWTAQTGGTQITDLLAADGVTAITSVTTLADGTLPLFYGPATGLTVMWANGGGAELARIQSDPSAAYAAIAAPRFFTNDHRVYVSASGSDSNNGLSPGEAFLTIAHAASVLGTTGGHIMVGAGFFSSSTTVALSNVNDLTIEGTGDNQTLYSLSAGVTAFTLNNCARVKFKKMWIGCLAGAQTSSAGIDYQAGNSYCDLDDVTFQNLDLFGLRATGLQQSFWQRLRMILSIATWSGDGIKLTSCVSLRIRDVISTASVGSFGGIGLNLDYDNDTIVGDAIELIGFTGGGVLLHNSAGGAHTGPRLVRLNRVFVETAGADGYLISDGRYTRFTDCEAAVCTGNGFKIAGGHGAHLRGCDSLENGLHNYYITGTPEDTSIVDCNAAYASQTTTLTSDNCHVDGTVSHTRIVDNRFGDTVLSLTNRSRYGLAYDVGGDFHIASGNDLSSNGTGNLLNNSAGANNSIQAPVGGPLAVLGIVRPSFIGLGIAGITIGSVNSTRFFRVVEGGSMSKVRITVQVASGNICVALHANTGSGLSAAPGTVKASSGSVACPAAGSQDIALGSTVVAVPGDWISIGADNTTATFNGVSGATDGTSSGGLAGVAAIFPATGTVSGFTPGNNRLIEVVGVP